MNTGEQLSPTQYFGNNSPLLNALMFGHGSGFSYPILKIRHLKIVSLLRTIPVKELGLENDKQLFKGAFFVSGYSLYDILNSKKAKKAAGNTFSPLIDMYVIVENDRGEKAVFSWGEIYFTKESSNVLISKSIQAINPAKTKRKWPLPEEPRLVCGNDLLNVRFISNPTKITVRSYAGEFAAEKPRSPVQRETTR